MLKYTSVAAPFGAVGIVAGAAGLRATWMTGRSVNATNQELGRRYPEARHDAALLPPLQRQLSDYLAGKRVQFRVRVDLSELTEFQRRVLDACATVGYGETITYGQLARLVNNPRASRAVGAALGRNPVPLVIPCHRIVASNGALGGFSAEQGIRVKRWLLDLESPAVTRKTPSLELRAGKAQMRLAVSH